MKINFELGWVQAIKMEETKGISIGSINKMKERGKLIQGKHWKKWQGRLYYHYERINELIENDNVS